MIELGKLNCSSIWEQLNSSNLLRLWRTGANEIHYEANETFRNGCMYIKCIYLHVYSLFKDLLQDLKLKEGEFALSKDTTVSL